MRETAISFGTENTLVGIITDPSSRRPSLGEIGVILLNAGVLHRVGPGRIYVKIARQLAAIGLTVLRFDFSGIGDSKPRRDSLPFERSSIEETQRAMDFLEAERGIRRFILIGGCSGARVSFAAAACDPRIAGAILINFQVTPDRYRGKGTQEDKRKDEHYYLRFAIRSVQSWRKFLAGGAEYRKIAGAVVSRLRHKFGVRNSPPSPEWLAFRKDLNALIDCGIRLVFVCSAGDPALDELREAGGSNMELLCSRNKMEVVVIARSDHTFSSLCDQERVIKVLEQKSSEIAQIALSPASPWSPPSDHLRGNIASVTQV